MKKLQNLKTKASPEDIYYLLKTQNSEVTHELGTLGIGDIVSTSSF